MCSGDTGIVGENVAQMCVVLILGQFGEMEHSCVWW